MISLCSLVRFILFSLFFILQASYKPYFLLCNDFRKEVEFTEFFFSCFQTEPQDMDIMSNAHVNLCRMLLSTLKG